jgi:ribosomal protein L11 methyltransferase
MPWLELSIRCTRRDWPRIESALEEIGALSVTLLDAEDEPILEPGPGETPLWRELRANALFDAGADRRGIGAVLQELVPWFDPARLEFREVADADWTRAWMDQYQPMRFGRRLWIYPSTIEPPQDADAVVVRLDPGLAFGTGTHPTTALCLEWLDGLDLAGARVLDYGCGSGVLAIAALKLGAAAALALDNDPQALAATMENARRNDIDVSRLVVRDPADGAVDSHDVVVANILAGALLLLEPVLAAACRPGGRIALSGILREQADAVRGAYTGHFADLRITEREGWVRIDGIRRESQPVLV